MTETMLATQATRALWAAGDYDYVATRLWEVGGHVVRAAAVTAGERVLDVAAGTGNAAVQAAEAGARVVALDLAPELFEAGRARAHSAGVDVEWVEGDTQALPFEDGAFDVVLSTFGCMFAPDQARTAAEMARVLRPGGRIGIASWRPEGWILGFFKLFAAYRPPPPDAPSPLAWGDPDHVAELFAAGDVELASEPHVLQLRYGSVRDTVVTYTTKFGPGIAAVAQAAAAGRADALRAELAALCEPHASAQGVSLPAAYLLSAGHRRA